MFDEHLDTGVRYKVAGDTPLKPSRKLANTSRKFDESFQRIFNEKFQKLSEAIRKNERYSVQWNVNENIANFLKQE